ncbi:MAG: dienelactone hydrolase family protein [Actinomycetota bacterium]
MAEVVLFHHVQGLTDGVRVFAEAMRAGGHIVHTPDLFDGQRPATIDDGIAYTQSIGGEVLGERADRAVADLPEGVPVQIHGMDKDPFFALEGDIDAARELVEAVGSELAELFVYPGDRHLFSDSSLPSYDAAATALVVQRSRELLDRVG